MEVNDNDRLIVALDYILMPVLPLVLLLIEDQREKPFIKAHNAQALVMGIILLLAELIFGITCIVPFITVIIRLYLAYQAFQGLEVNIPGVTEFVKNQGWA